VCVAWVCIYATRVYVYDWVLPEHCKVIYGDYYNAHLSLCATCVCVCVQVWHECVCVGHECVSIQCACVPMMWYCSSISKTSMKITTLPGYVCVISVCACMFVCVSAFVSVRVSVRVRACVSVCVCVYVYVYVCAYTHANIISIYIHI